MAKRKPPVEFIGESPVTLERHEKAIEATQESTLVSLDGVIAQVDQAFLNNKIDEDEYIRRLTKMYIDNVYFSECGPITTENKLKLNMAYFITHGERSKIERRKHILFNMI